MSFKEWLAANHPGMKPDSLVAEDVRLGWMAAKEDAVKICVGQAKYLYEIMCVEEAAVAERCAAMIRDDVADAIQAERDTSRSLISQLADADNRFCDLMAECDLLRNALDNIQRVLGGCRCGECSKCLARGIAVAALAERTV